MVHARVAQRLDHAEVGIGQGDVLADHRHRHARARVLDALDQLHPAGVVRDVGLVVDLEVFGHHLAETRGLEHEGDLVDRFDVRHGHDRFARHVREQSDLLLEVGCDRHFRATDDRVRLDADRAQRLHGMLRRLRLHLLTVDDGHQGAVHVEHVLPAEVVLHLPDRLEERKALDVADSPAHLDDHGIDLRVARGAEDLLLDHIRDVRNDLHRRPQVVAASLAGDDLLVDLPGRHVRGDGQVLVDEALVVPEVEVGLSAVVRDEHLAVLVGAHGAGVDVEVRVELLE